MNFLKFADKGIRYLFYAIFFITPLVLYPKTFELFEFNKLWVLFGLSIVILFLWTGKMILSGKIIFKRTPFDIPILLFLLSQIISTIFSMEPHTSFWGYYARFNGGLLSITTYIFLYYAFVNNMLESESQRVRESKFSDSPTYRVLLVSLLSGIVVALWGIPSHFGFDFTCLVFRGSLDTSCWTDAFQPMVRMFSTLGQPNWLAAFMAVLIPIAVAFGLTSENKKVKGIRLDFFYYFCALLFYICILWSASQSGLLGLTVGFLFFLGIVGATSFKTMGFKDKTLRNLAVLCALLSITTFVIGVRTSSLASFSLEGFLKQLSPATALVKSLAQAAPPPVGELGGSDSGEIRKIVWKGAIDIFKKHPLIGTGVETFAYSYYSVKPIKHNLLSEWDYLYNKAHNEYLNYLATTGALGLGTYLLMIGWFVFYSVKYLKTKIYNLESKNDRSYLLDHRYLLTAALLASYISILVSNFFGFSVVIMNLFLFMISALVLGIEGRLNDKKANEEEPIMTPLKSVFIIIVGIVCVFLELSLLNMWLADIQYSQGYNLNRAQQYVMANPYLENAVKLNSSEDIYKDELATNIATLAVLFNQQNEATQAALTANRAKALSDEVISRHPNNIVFFKSRTQVSYLLAQVDKKYYKDAVDAINHGMQLAPTDAKIAYNAGLLYGQQGDIGGAIKMLKKAIELKPNYRDPRYALATYLSQEAKTETDPEKKQQELSEAKETLEYSLKNINSADPKIKELLQSIE